LDHINRRYFPTRRFPIFQTKLSKPSYDTCFKATKATFIDESLLEIIAPTTFAAEWLENKYTNLIKSTLYDYLGRNINIKYSIGRSEEHTSELQSREKLVC